MAEKSGLSRRDFLASAARGASLVAAGCVVGSVAAGGHTPALWQIDPLKCIQCGKCATECVLKPSAARCINAFPMCGYCKLCFGYFEVNFSALNEGAENQLCPTGALKRKWVEDQYWEYTVQSDLCIACARCVKGCVALGNGSLFLQIDQSICVHCNDCSIARACPSRAISRVKASSPYILLDKTGGG